MRRWRCLHARSRETSRFHEMLAKELTAQAAVRDESSGMRRVNEASMAHVYADVIDAPRVNSKEEEVAGKQVRQRHGSGRALLFRGRAWDRDSGLFVGVDGKAA